MAKMFKIYILAVFLLLLYLTKNEALPIKNKEKCNNSNGFCLFNDHQNTKKLCELCYLVAPLARELIRKGQIKDLHFIATLICTALNITQEPICSQAISLFELPVLNIINDTTLNDNELCSVALNCFEIQNPILNWNISLPNVPKPPFKPPVPPKPDAPKLRILHITDIHTDLEYQPGSIAECGQPLCCRNSSKGLNSNLTDASMAGYWGDYRNCDVPLWTVQNMFEHIAKNEEFDFVYWTGDLPAHNVWNQSKSDQINSLRVLTSLFMKYFPDKIIYPTLGNHESSPVNLYPMPNIKEDNISWLYNEIAQDWIQTGLPINLTQNIQKGGFYTIVISPGLRIVSLNMNYCPSGNFWLYVNSTDPLDQLKWLINILLESEKINEKVHIIGHIHPSGCLKSWSYNYYKIVNRFESTITGQFFGHSHSDSFELFYDLDNLNRTIGIAYIAGSVTTYSYLNPGYRVYTVDGIYSNSSWQVLDYENYYMNLTEANLNGKNNLPTWKKEYSAKDAFNLSSIYPNDWNNLINYMLKNLNSPLVDNLLKFYTKSADVSSSCDNNCRRNFLCGYKQARSDSFVPC